MDPLIGATLIGAGSSLLSGLFGGGQPSVPKEYREAASQQLDWARFYEELTRPLAEKQIAQAGTELDMRSQMLPFVIQEAMGSYQGVPTSTGFPGQGAGNPLSPEALQTSMFKPGAGGGDRIPQANTATAQTSGWDPVDNFSKRQIRRDQSLQDSLLEEERVQYALGSVTDEDADWQLKYWQNKIRRNLDDEDDQDQVAYYVAKIEEKRREEQVAWQPEQVQDQPEAPLPAETPTTPEAERAAPSYEAYQKGPYSRQQETAAHVRQSQDLERMSGAAGDKAQMELSKRLGGSEVAPGVMAAMLANIQRGGVESQTRSRVALTQAEGAQSDADLQRLISLIPGMENSAALMGSHQPMMDLSAMSASAPSYAQANAASQQGLMGNIMGAVGSYYNYQQMNRQPKNTGGGTGANNYYGGYPQIPGAGGAPGGTPGIVPQWGFSGGPV